MTQPSVVDMRPAIMAEIAASLNELANDATAALADFTAGNGETAGAAPTVQVLNGSSLLIEGAAAGAANFLRGRGYSVVESGGILLAKTKRRPAKRANAAEGMTLRSAKAGGHMEVYTDATDVNTLKRLYQKAVGNKSAISFNMFCQQVDDIGAMHRQLYGDNSEAGENEGGGEAAPVQPPAPIGRGGATVMASEEAPAPRANDTGVAVFNTTDAV